MRCRHHFVTPLKGNFHKPLVFLKWQMSWPVDFTATSTFTDFRCLFLTRHAVSAQCRYEVTHNSHIFPHMSIRIFNKICSFGLQPKFVWKGIPYTSAIFISPNILEIYLGRPTLGHVDNTFLICIVQYFSW